MTNLMDYLPEPAVDSSYDDNDSERLIFDSGEEILLERTPGGRQRMRVVSPSGELLLAYDPSTAETQVLVPQGDLKFVVPEGNIDFQAGRKVRLQGSELELTTNGLGPDTKTTISLRPGRLWLKSAVVGFLGKRGEVLFDETKVVGSKVEGTVKQAKLLADRVDVVADSMRTRAQYVFQSVEKLLETKTGRLRTLVDSTYHLLSGEVKVKAKKDVSIDGKMLYLG